jgi:hypothetical protein
MVFMVQECKVTVLGDYDIELTNKVIDKFRDMGLLYGVVPVAGLYPEANITIVEVCEISQISQLNTHL